MMDWEAHAYAAKSLVVILTVLLLFIGAVVGIGYLMVHYEGWMMAVFAALTLGGGYASFYHEKKNRADYKRSKDAPYDSGELY